MTPVSINENPVLNSITITNDDLVVSFLLSPQYRSLPIPSSYGSIEIYREGVLIITHDWTTLANFVLNHTETSYGTHNYDIKIIDTSGLFNHRKTIYYIGKRL